MTFNIINTEGRRLRALRTRLHASSAPARDAFLVSVLVSLAPQLAFAEASEVRADERAGASVARNVDEDAQIQLPSALEQVVPELPPDAALGVNGEAILLEVQLDKTGKVRDASVVHSLGSVLDHAALRAVYQTKFSPALRGSEAIPAKFIYQVRFAQASLRKRRPVKKELIRPNRKATPKASVISEDEQLIVVTGARVPTPERNSVVGTEVVTREEIEKIGAQSAEDILFARRGLQFQRSFRGTELWVRGLDPEYTLILINGQRVPGRIGGALDLSRYPVERIERVEIVRGPSSALYGSEAIAGVVNIITREVEEPLSADAQFRIASEDAYSGNIRVAGKAVSWLGIEASAGRIATDAFSLDDSEGTSGSAQVTDSLGGQLSFGSSKKQRVTASADYTKIRITGVDASGGGALFDRTQLQEQLLGSLMHTYGNDRFYLNSSLSYSSFKEQRLTDQRGSDALDEFQLSEEALYQLQSTGDYAWSEQQKSTIGGEVLAQRLKSDRLNGDGARNRYAVFAQHKMSFGPGFYQPEPQGERVIVVPGVRADFDSQFGDQVSPKISVRWDIIAPMTVRASYGRGFRAPSFQQLQLRFENPSVGYVVEGNPNLKAERSHGVDVALEYKPFDELFFLVAGFRNDLSNMIATITASEGASGTVFSYENLGKAYTQGIESQLVLSLNPTLNLTAGYTLTDAQDLENQKRIEGQAPHVLFSRVRLLESWSQLALIVRGTLTLGRPYYLGPEDAEELVIANPLAQVDLIIERSFNKSFEAFAGINNLLNAGDNFAQLLPRQYFLGMRGHY